MPHNPLEITETIATHPKLIVTDDYEIVAQKIEGHNKKFTNGEEVSYQKNENYWVSLRLKYRGRPGKGIITSISKHSINHLVEQTMNMAKLSSPDPWFNFPLLKKTNQSQNCITPTSELKSAYETISTKDEIIEEFYDSQVIETAIKRKEEKFLLHQFQKINNAKFLVLSTKAEVWLKDHRVTQDDLSKKDEWVNSLTVQVECIKKSSFFKEKGMFRILFSPKVLAVILENISDFFISGKSAFKEGRIFSEYITIIDKKNLGEETSFHFDLEGILGQKTLIIDKGYVSNLLSDSYLARKENKLSTGNYFRKLNKNWPEVDISCIYIQPGIYSLDSLISELNDGLALDSILFIERLHEASSLFLLNCCGLRVIKRNFVEYIRDVKICIDINELFKRVIAVGDNIQFFGRFGAPSVLFDKVQII